MKLNRLLVLITPLLVFVLFQALLIYQNRIFLFFALFFSCLFILFTIKRFVGSGFNLIFFNFSIIPILFVLSSFFYSLIIYNKFFLEILFFINLLFLYFYFRNLFLLFIAKDIRKEEYFNNVSFYVSFLIVFFFSSSIFGIQSLLGVSTSPLIFSILPIFGLLIYNIVWINEINFKIGYIYILLICVVFFELAWSLSFLPLSYNILGLVLAICYYMSAPLLKFHLKGILNTRLVKLHLSLGFLSILTVLLTAKWM